MARFAECFPRETKFWKYVRSGFCIGLTCLLAFVAYKTLVSTSISYIYTSSSRNSNEAHDNDIVSSLIDSKDFLQSNLKKTVLDANFTSKYMLDGKDTCKVWRGKYTFVFISCNWFTNKWLAVALVVVILFCISRSRNSSTYTYLLLN